MCRGWRRVCRGRHRCWQRSRLGACASSGGLARAFDGSQQPLQGGDPRQVFPLWGVGSLGAVVSPHGCRGITCTPPGVITCVATATKPPGRPRKHARNFPGDGTRRVRVGSQWGFRRSTLWWRCPARCGGCRRCSPCCGPRGPRARSLGASLRRGSRGHFGISRPNGAPAVQLRGHQGRSRPLRCVGHCGARCRAAAFGSPGGRRLPWRRAGAPRRRRSGLGLAARGRAARAVAGPC
mmetsp:Transcript_57401/g.170820  ORF Transcript_57401/g.170820 Transcript_57401/m.170820 type:complete len:237 (+) Transcript_57401:498-1208(+)